MLRIFLLQLFLFLLPFIGYGIYVWVRHGLEQAQRSYDVNRLTVLVLAGLGCVALGLVVLAAFGDREAGDYVPLQYRDGELVPGGFGDDE
jgi:nicotinamide riboside transporter PnuC